MITNNDLKDLEARGITPETVQNQLKNLAEGFPYLKLQNAATPGEGILVPDDDTTNNAIAAWDQYVAQGGVATKMVPASGAASRMFKALFAFVDGEANEPEPGSDAARVIAEIDKLAFTPALDERLSQLHGMTAKELIAEKRYKDVIAGIIRPEGLDYGSLPKGLLLFHQYTDGARTPLEEQLVEGAQTLSGAPAIPGTTPVVKMHFTVSAEHRAKFEERIAVVVPALEQRLGVKYDISLSVQKPSTDTIAANPDGTPLRDNGHLVFRPGGHGALISNLNDLDSPIVFIKNIDNVVPDARRDDTVYWKKVLGGLLVLLRGRINKYLEMLESGNYTIDDLRQMITFMHDKLNIRHPQMKLMDDSELAIYIKGKLNRPIRVCGMVRNTGEPGGGPYIAFDADGSTSPQILESTQIDMSQAEYAEIMQHSTHFNPVDLVCSLVDAQGNHFDLTKHVDPSTGFISSKSLHGRPLKALELPGLWNGAMSDWNTLFVEVPASTFNPVKTVADLLRPAHQQP